MLGNVTPELHAFERDFFDERIDTFYCRFERIIPCSHPEHAPTGSYYLVTFLVCTGMETYPMLELVIRAVHQFAVDLLTGISFRG